MLDRPHGGVAAPGGALAIDSTPGRWIIIGSVLGSAAAFLETSVVSVALPVIGRDLNLGVEGLQWVTNAYLVTLGALMLLGGALGDRFPRSRVFAFGLVGFAVACGGCALAPSAAALVACRGLQGVFAALLVPNSLAVLETAFAGEDRGVAIGRWSGWSAISTALGPLLGGALIDRVSWRWVFACMMPFALAAAWIALRHGSAADGPQTTRAARAASPDDASGRIDYLGACLATLGIGGIVAALTSAATSGSTALVTTVTGGGVACLVACVVVEHRSPHPLLPFEIFRSRAFSGTNIVTLFVYAALSGMFFMLMLELQDVMGYSGLAAGAALLPTSVLMLVISPWAGRLAHRIGPRLPMTLGAAVAAVGMALFTRVRPGASYVGAVLVPAIVFGCGLSLLVAPLTTAVLGSLDAGRAGIASGVNNAVARLGGLLATAALPLVVGVGGSTPVRDGKFTMGFVRAMWINAALCAAGGIIAWLVLTPERRTVSDRVSVGTAPAG